MDFSLLCISVITDSFPDGLNDFGALHWKVKELEFMIIGNLGNLNDGIRYGPDLCDIFWLANL
jgi:hypothetical protein